MKKQMTTAMAAAMAFGTVVPAAAQVIENKTIDTVVISDITDKDSKVESRLTQGLQIVANGTKNTFKRSEVYNNTKTEDTSDDTLKTQFTGCTVLAVKEAKKSKDDLIVLAKKITKREDLVKVEAEKAKLAKIEELKKEDNVIGIKEKTVTEANFDDKGMYTPEVKIYEIITLLEGTNTVVRDFYATTHIDNYVGEETEKTEKQLVDELREEVFGLEVVLKDRYDFKKLNKQENKEERYKEYKELLKTIEANKDKFDIVVDEAGQNNEERITYVYRKGGDKTAEGALVLSYEEVNMEDYDDSFIVEIPEKNDFTGHWAEDLIVEGMLSGDILLSDTFRPNDSITRAEFAKLITTMYGGLTPEKAIKDYENGKYSESFSDVPNNSWYAPYVAFVQTEGIAQGTKIDEEFSPNEAITREEAAIMISRMAKIANQDALDKNVEDTNGDGMADTFLRVEDSKFTDIASANAWADHTIEKLATTKFTPKDEKEQTLIKGYEDGTFRPQNEVTRAESLSLITQVLKYNESK